MVVQCANRSNVRLAGKPIAFQRDSGCVDYAIPNREDKPSDFSSMISQSVDYACGDARPRRFPAGRAAGRLFSLNYFLASARIFSASERIWFNMRSSCSTHFL